MYLTYVMGVDNSIYDLENQGFKIEPEWDNFKVSFPENKLSYGKNLSKDI